MTHADTTTLLTTPSHTPLDAAAFEAQLEAATRRGFVTALRMLRNPDAARDACQEAASRALAARHRYDPERPFAPWFWRILHNHCLDLLRSRSPAPTREDPTTLIDHLPTPDRNAEAHVLAHERQRAVLLAIQKLPDNHRTLIELRHFQDMSYDDIAVALDCPVGTVMSRLYRARKALRDILSRNDTWSRS